MELEYDASTVKGFENRKFSPPSIWEPTGMPPTALEAFQMANELDLSLLKVHSPPVQNLTKDERLAMEELKNNTEIVIKPADKGSAVVVMNRSDYMLEGLRQLSDENFYLAQDECLTAKHNAIIGAKINEMVDEGEITEKKR